MAHVPYLVQVSHPAALSNVTLVFITRALTWPWKERRVCFSPSLYLHLPLLKVQHKSMNGWEGESTSPLPAHPFAMLSSLSEKQNLSFIPSLPCISLAQWFFLFDSLFWLKFSTYQLQLVRSVTVLTGKFHGTLFTLGMENICYFHVWMPGFRGQGWRLWGSGQVSGCKQHDEQQLLTSSFCLFSTGNIAVEYNELGLSVLNASSLASETGYAYRLLVLNCIFILEEIILRSSLVAPSRGEASVRADSRMARKKWPAFVWGVEGLSCLNRKGSEEAIMLSK